MKIEFEKQFGPGVDPWHAKAERWVKKKFKNPYSSSNLATSSCTINDANVGCTLIAADGSDSLKISTCYETACSATGSTTLVDIISLK